MGEACSPEGKPIPSAPRAGIFQSLQLSRRARSSQQIPRWRDGSPAQSPPGHCGVCRGARLPSGCPRDRGRFLCNSATPNHPTQQESSGFGLAPVRDFCLMAIFLPLLWFPQTTLQHPKDTETAGNSPQSKEGKTHNSPPTAACPAWIVQPEEQI